jgi:hypothetical protein
MSRKARELDYRICDSRLVFFIALCWGLTGELQCVEVDRLRVEVYMLWLNIAETNSI